MGISSSNLFDLDPGILQKDAFIIIISTEWNASIVNKLEEGCLSILNKYHMNNIKTIIVPGAFEIPFAIKAFWDSCAETFKKPHAFIALGCVVRGDTPHFDYICKAVTEGINQLNLTLPVPSIFGVLTVDDQQQAMERVGGKYGNKGEEAAITALKMIALKQSFYTDNL